MTMSNNGLSKLIEECGEVLQIAGKLLAYPNGRHPDGKGDLKSRLELELGDLRAAIQFVIETHRLDGSCTISEQYARKLALFREWHADPNN